MGKDKKNLLTSIIKNILPGCIVQYLQFKRRAVHFYGNYSSWEEASAHASGYDQTSILEKVKSSVTEVLNGNAVFERDGVLFFQEDPNYPLLTAFFRSTADKKELKVLDYGGGLGSVFFQNRKFFSHFETISWRIVEQKNFVTAGRALFRKYDVPVTFYDSLEGALRDWTPDIILFSSVLQYLPEYRSILQNVKQLGAECIILARCLVFEKESLHRYCVQKVESSIYKASYAVQVLNRQELISEFAPEYVLEDEFSSYSCTEILQNPRGRAHYHGMVFRYPQTRKNVS
jgi:putative methyltransferase (TIGR04325 family)